MKKTAFVFPGQGAQYIGMSRDFYEQSAAGKAVFEMASEVTGLDLPALCLEENDKINITEYTQIAMLTAEAAILAEMQARGLTSQVNAGLSLGEYGALIASGVLSVRDAFRVVRRRGILMQEAVPEGGAMAAVIGMDGEKIAAICAATAGIVSVANFNCPGQIVITGAAEAVAKAGDSLKEAGARRIIPLKVSGPFHSEMLTGAGQKLAAELNEIQIGTIKTPYITNVTAAYVTDPQQVKDLLIQQISSPVKWQQSVERMIADGVDTFVEIGPGKTLTGFLRKINRDVTGVNIETLADLEQVAALLKE